MPNDDHSFGRELIMMLGQIMVLSTQRLRPRLGRQHSSAILFAHSGGGQRMRKPIDLVSCLEIHHNDTVEKRLSSSGGLSALETTITPGKCYDRLD